MGKGDYKPPAEPDLGGIDAESFSSSQEVVPVKWTAGTQRVAVTWVGRPYNIVARDAPQDVPGKK
jgi:hypothetical protein